MFNLSLSSSSCLSLYFLFLTNGINGGINDGDDGISVDSSVSTVFMYILISIRRARISYLHTTASVP